MYIYFSVIFYKNLLIDISVDVIFYTTNVVAIICFLNMTRQWPAFMNYWKFIEDSMSRRYKPSKTLKYRLTVTTSIFLTAAISILLYILCSTFTNWKFSVEHLLSIVNFVYGEHCYEAKKVSVPELYFRRQFDCVFNYITYSHALAIALTVVF